KSSGIITEKPRPIRANPKMAKYMEVVRTRPKPTMDNKVPRPTILIEPIFILIPSARKRPKVMVMEKPKNPAPHSSSGAKLTSFKNRPLQSTTAPSLPIQIKDINPKINKGLKFLKLKEDFSIGAALIFL